jgi:hypothetical protein
MARWSVDVIRKRSEHLGVVAAAFEPLVGTGRVCIICHKRGSG